LDVLGKVTTDLLEEFDPRLAGRKQVNPSQFLGIEINPRAAAIAELVIWIGYLQWHFKRYGTTPPPEPILQDFHNIEFRDAVLVYDGRELDVDAKTGKVRSRWGGRTMRHPVTGEDVPDPSDQVPIYRYINPRPAVWQEADYIVSNPPFIGKINMREALGDGYVQALRATHKDIPDSADLVMYWWDQAAHLTRQNKIKAFGFISTNSLRQTYNRRVTQTHLEAGKESISLIFAIPDHPWVDGVNDANVRISMTAGVLRNSDGRLLEVIREEYLDASEDTEIQLDFKSSIGKIQANLTIGASVTKAISLQANSKVANTGLTVGGRGFLLDEQEYQQLITSEPSSKSLIFPVVNGRDLTDRCRNLWIVDTLDLSENTLIQDFPKIYQHLFERVYPERQTNPDPKLRKYWWLPRRSNEKVRNSIAGINRYIATVLTSKHRVFTFLDSDVRSEISIVVIAIEDAYHLGILSSYIHLTWALAVGATLEDRPRYIKSHCFEAFPFPDATLEQKEKIRQLGERLDRHRKQVQAQHPEITITGMYNLLEKLRKGEDFTDKDREYNNKALVSTLKQIHDELDNAVLEAYGWEDLKPLLLDNPPSPLAPLPKGEGNKTQIESSALTNQFQTASSLPSPSGRGAGGEGLTEIILDRLVTLNAQRAEEERNGHIRWLRPEYQAPNEVRTQTIIEGVGESEEVAIAPAEIKTFPKQPKDQLAAIRDLLRTSNNPWTIAQLAAQFKNGNRYKNAISENLERLEWFGILHCHQVEQIKYWQHLETQQVG
jgi:hypothetical protein